MTESSHIAQIFGVKRETRGRQSDTQIDIYWKQLAIGKEYVELLNVTPAKRGSGRAARIADQLSYKYDTSPGTIKRCRTMYIRTWRVFNKFDISANDDLSAGLNNERPDNS